MVAHLDGQLEEADVVRHGRAVLPHCFGNLLLRQAELLGQATVGMRLLDWIQILPLDVFDEGSGKQALVGDVPHDDGDLLQPGTL